MTKMEKTIRDAAARCLPSSADALVKVYACATTRLNKMELASLLSLFLTIDNERRGEMLAAMRRVVEREAASRKGPKAERYRAAREALAELDALIAGLPE